MNAIILISIIIILLLLTKYVNSKHEGFFDPRIDKRPEWIKDMKMASYKQLRKRNPIMLDKLNIVPVQYHDNFILANNVYREFGSFAHPFTGKSFR